MQVVWCGEFAKDNKLLSVKSGRDGGDVWCRIWNAQSQVEDRSRYADLQPEELLSCSPIPPWKARGPTDGASGGIIRGYNAHRGGNKLNLRT